MFSRDAKDEVAGIGERRSCCAATFVRGLLLFGANRGSAGVGGATIASQRASVARAIIAAAHRAGIAAHARRAPRATMGGRWSVTLPDLRGAGARRSAALSIPRRACCRRTLLRVGFLVCGSVSDPSRAYNAEFFCRRDDAARVVCDVLAAFDIDAGMTRRRGRPLVYIKDAQSVSALLGFLGATHAVLRLEAMRAVRQTKNSIRRTVNSEAANAARAASAAARQREAARRAMAAYGRSDLSRVAREAAQLRIAYPTRTLRELAQAARPPITKAAMGYRLRLLERLTKR